MRASVFSNALWNVVNGSSSALVAVLVPPFLTRFLGAEAYGAWALALQIGTYVTLFGFGIQMAVGRYVAFSEAREDFAARDGIVATSFWFLLVASALGWLAICSVAIGIHQIVPNLSSAVVAETRWAIILVGLALAINLPASIFAAVFTGMHRSDVPAKIQGTGRLVQAAALIAAGPLQNLAVLGLVYLIVSVGTVTVLAIAWRRGTRAPTLARRHVARTHGRELFGFCLSLTLWNFAMLLVTGLDLIIVGRFDYGATPYYAVSLTLVTLVSGTLSSLGSALVPAAASLPDEADSHLQNLLMRSSRLIIGASLIMGVPLIFEGHVVLAWWLGEAYADRAAPLLALLVAAAVIRNSMIAYVTIAIGTGYQRRMIATPLIEGIVTVAASVAFASIAGAAGAALAKIAGAACGVTLLIGQHALRDRLGALPRWRYAIESILQPCMAFLPGMLAALLFAHISPIVVPGEIRFIGVALVTLAAVWAITLKAVDRDFITSLIRARLAGHMRGSA